MSKFTKAELANLKKLSDSVKDDRLSPMTYKKLKELGVSSSRWKNMTQEEANKFIASHSKQNKKGNKSSAEKERRASLSGEELADNVADLLNNSPNKYVEDITVKQNGDVELEIDRDKMDRDGSYADKVATWLTKKGYDAESEEFGFITIFAKKK